MVCYGAWVMVYNKYIDGRFTVGTIVTFTGPEGFLMPN